MRNSALGPGSTWVGSWKEVSQFSIKAFFVKSYGGTSFAGTPSAGSFAILGGITGTDITNSQGTLYGFDAVIRRRLDRFRFDEPVQYVRPVMRMSGITRGTLVVGFGEYA